MDPAGAPWRDPRRAYGGYAVGSTTAKQATARQQSQQPRSDARGGAAAVTGGVLKRSLGEMEMWQQQKAMYLRSVRQRAGALQPMGIGGLLGGVTSPSPSRAYGISALSPGFGGISPQLSSLTTASRTVVPGFQHLQRQMMAAPAVQSQVVARGPVSRPATASELVLLQELEKQLLDDDYDATDKEGSTCGSGVTTSDWGDTIQKLNSITAASSPSPPLPTTAVNKTAALLSLSPTNSSSSTASSSASSSPPIPTASSRQLLSEAAAAIADGNHKSAASHLSTLKLAANPRGDAEQRLVAIMVAAMSSRVGAAPTQNLTDIYTGEHRAACQLLQDVSPCFGLALHGANLAIIDAVAGHRAIHLVDFDVSAAQHVALIKALADRRLPATSLKLGCEPGEALAVNLAFTLSRVPDESVSPANPRDELLRRVRALGPRVVTLVEQEFISNSEHEHGAVLDLLDATLGRDSAERARAEAALAGKVANAVGREGPDRVERCEVFGKWRPRFGMAGFRAVAIGENVAGRVRARLGPLLPAFDVKVDNGRLGVGWMGRVVTVASAWH
uniref:Uncharacterized protein n=1 Tax=Leersia perrieri TaxID=77586 RepID=A0A0D9VJJ3_9ORYZ